MFLSNNLPIHTLTADDENGGNSQSNSENSLACAVTWKLYNSQVPLLHNIKLAIDEAGTSLENI